MANDLNPVNIKLMELFSSNSIITDFVGKHPVKKVWEIYFGMAPQDHSRPCLVFSLLGSNMRRGTGGRKIFNVMIFAVKLITEGDSIKSAGPVLSEIERICLTDQLTDDQVVIGMSPTDAFAYSEVLEGGVRINHLGYNIEVFTYNTF